MERMEEIASSIEHNVHEPLVESLKSIQQFLVEVETAKAAGMLESPEVLQNLIHKEAAQLSSINDAMRSLCAEVGHLRRLTHSLGLERDEVEVAKKDILSTARLLDDMTQDVEAIRKHVADEAVTQSPSTSIEEATASAHNGSDLQMQVRAGDSPDSKLEEAKAQQVLTQSNIQEASFDRLEQLVRTKQEESADWENSPHQD